jgi:hypothetical protein
MKKYRELLSELPSKTVVVTFGQFNPPSVGHELLVKVVRKLAKQRKADHTVFVSSVQDKKNPLEIGKKIQYLETLFPNTKFVQREIGDAIHSLKKYKNVVVVSPAESVEDYKKMFKRNGIDAEFVQAGTKCPDSDDKLIKLATKGEYQSFKTALPTSARELDAKRLMNDVRHGIGLEPIKEQINLVKDELREQYFRGEIFNEGDIVESDNEVYRIIKRGSNHLLLQSEQGSKVSKWIQDVQLTEREFMLDEKQLQEAETAGAVGVNNTIKKAQSDSEKAQLQAAQAEEKVKLVDKQKKEMDNLKQTLQKEDSPVVNTNSKYNIAKSVMSLSDFRKSMSQSKPIGSEGEKALEKKVEDGLVGNAHMDGGQSRKMKIKHHLGEGNGYDDNRTGFAKKPREDDEYHNEPKPKFKPKSTMDRPHTVHIGGKPWKKFPNGHQAHAAANTLQAKGKDAVAVAHFSEETEEEKGDRKTQLKRFKDQAGDAKLGTGDLEEARMSAAVKLQRAFEREQEKSAASRQRAQELLNPKKEEPKPVKEDLEFPEIDDDQFMAEVQQDLDNLAEEEFFEAYDDEELAIIDDETGEEIEAVSEETQLDAPALMEVLSRHERIMAKARMRRTKAKRVRAEKVALRKFSSPEVANKRARRMAISSMKKRLLKGRNPQKVSVGERERVERFIAQRKKVVDRLSARMVTRVKQVEKARMSHKKFTKPNNGVTF